MYDQQQKSILDLRNWVLESVDDSLLQSACKPGDELHDWYANLKDQVGT